jgi:hypothetical protein
MQAFLDTFMSVLPKHIGFSESMSGTHTFLEGPNAGKKLAIRFTIDVKSLPLPEFLNVMNLDTFFVCDIAGTLTAEGLVEKTPAKGRLLMRYFHEQKLHYYLEFEGPDGKQYYFKGEKRNIWPWNIWKTHFRLYSGIYEKETNKMVSEGMLYFLYSDLPKWITTFKLMG